MPTVVLSDSVSDPWDVAFVDAMDNHTLFGLILAANYLGIPPLCMYFVDAMFCVHDQSSNDLLIQCI